MREREESVGKKKKMNQVARVPAAHADLRKEGTLLAFVSERGPCVPVREGKRSAKTEK